MKKAPTLTYARVSNPADVDYWSKLSPEEQHWLRRFNRAEHFGRGDTTNPLPPETRREIDRNRNALRRDCYSRMSKVDDHVPDTGSTLEDVADCRRDLYVSVQVLIEIAAELPPRRVGASGNSSGPPTDGLHAASAASGNASRGSRSRCAAHAAAERSPPARQTRSSSGRKSSKRLGIDELRGG